MAQKHWRKRQQTSGRSMLRSAACALIGCLLARAVFYQTWSEALGFTVIIGIMFVVFGFIVDICEASVVEYPVTVASMTSSSLPQSNEEDGHDELRRFFADPTSAWRQAIEELSRRQRDAASHHEQKAALLEAARQREDDELFMSLGSRVDQLKLHLRNLQEAESGIRSLIAGIDLMMDELKHAPKQWDDPLIAKLHGLVKRFPLTPPKEGEDAKLIHYAEQLEEATAALNALKKKSN